MTVTEAEWGGRGGGRDGAANGDQAEWFELFAWLWPWTVQLAGSADYAMDGWLKVVRNPQLWLKPLKFFAQIFRNTGRDGGRTARRHERRVAALLAAGWTGVQQGSDAERNEIIKQACGRLLLDDQPAIALYLEGHSPKDISGILGIPFAIVSRRLRITRKALQDVLRA